jgi:outer membrane receptor protein involved in Fe transport
VTSESPVLDVTSTTIGTAFSGQLLSDLPAGRDANSVAWLAAGAVEGGGARTQDLAGNPSIMGASALENRYVVDELDTSDPAFGYAGSGISFNFVEEVQVKTGGYEAEFGGAMGGVINMITKSGGNEFHGDIFGHYMDEGIGGGTAEIPNTAGSSVTSSHTTPTSSIRRSSTTSSIWITTTCRPTTSPGASSVTTTPPSSPGRHPRTTR